MMGSLARRREKTENEAVGQAYQSTSATLPGVVLLGIFHAFY